MEVTFSTMTLIHMVPFVPMNFMSFAAGISVMSFCDFLKACIGIIPGTSLFFVLGTNFSVILSYIDSRNKPNTQNYYRQEVTRLTIVVFVTVIVVMMLIWLVKVYDALQISKKYE